MKKYEYNGKIYCEDDLSCEIDNYGGSLCDLYFALKEEGKAHENTVYYKEPESSDDYYESPEELIEAEFSDLEVEPKICYNNCNGWCTVSPCGGRCPYEDDEQQDCEEYEEG